MLGTHDLLLFLISCVLLNLTPGPDSILIMSRSAAYGWRAGSMAALGIAAGCYVHILAAALGLSAILASSAMAFTIVKLLGAAYLVYLGASALLSRQAAAADGTPAASVTRAPYSRRSTFMQGFLSNALNPKVALFFLAFVPQFIDPAASNKAAAFMLLGSLFVVSALIYCNGLALFTAFASQRIRISQTFKIWLNKTIGALFVAFGVKLAFSANQ